VRRSGVLIIGFAVILPNDEQKNRQYSADYQHPIFDGQVENSGFTDKPLHKRLHVAPRN
jgi:hypothetical protein